MRILYCWAALCLFAGAAESQASAQTEGSVQPAPLTAETFAAPPFVEDPELSPNGQFIAARFNTKGRQVLTILALYDKAAKLARLDLGDGSTDVDWWRWVNDDWLIVGVSATTPVEGEDIRVSRVLSFNRTTGQINKLAWKDIAQSGSDVIWTARDGSPRILLGIQRSIYEGLDFWTEVIDIDVSTGKYKTVMKPHTGIVSYYADASGAIRMGYGYDDSSRTARLLYRQQGSGQFKVIDRADYRREERLSFPNIFLPELNKALTISDDDDGYSSLYELDLATMSRGKKLFGVEGYDIDGVIENQAGDGVLGVVATDTARKVHWLDPALAETQAAIDKAVGQSRADIVSWSKDRTQLIVRVGSADQAGSYYIFNRATGGKMFRFAYVDPQLKMRRLAGVSTIRFKARDGIDMQGVLTLPPDRTQKALPLVLLPHGGPEARDSETYDWWVQFLAARGYAVFQPNYRGSTGFGTKFLKLGDGEWGLKMQDDLNDAVAHLANIGLVDAKRVCIVGASYGGYAALRAAQRDGAKYRCAISYAGVSDLGGMRRYDSHFLYGGAASDSWKKTAPNLGAVSPLQNAANFSTPVLLMHGKMDLRVPVGQSRQMADKLKTAGKVYRYVEQPLADHHFSREEDRLQFLKEMDAFLQQYNPS